MLGCLALQKGGEHIDVYLKAEEHQDDLAVVPLLNECF